MENNLKPWEMREFIDQLDGLAVLDRQGYYTYVSPNWEEYTDCPAEEAIGKTVWDIIPHTHATEVYETGNAVTYGLVSKNGTPAFTTYYPRFDKRGKVCGIFLYIVLRGGKTVEDLSNHVRALSKQVEYYENELALSGGAKYTLDSIAGKSPAIAELKKQIKLAARSSSAVLIRGETGSGKELIAHSIHNLSKRREGNFLRVSCAAIPAEQMERELFGDGSGAEGPEEEQRGRFARADGGSIFFDEINLLPATIQPRFLRALQEKEVDSGDGRQQSADARVITATNVNLERLMEEGKFRWDLYYRLNVISIQAPSLRDRREDIPLLADQFMRQYNHTLGLVVESIDEDALDMLTEYDWPGNVRELQYSIESAMNNVAGATLQKKHFKQLEERILSSVRRAGGREDFNLAVEKRAFERRLISDALVHSKGNRKEAAELLGISRTMLYKKLEQYNLVADD